MVTIGNQGEVARVRAYLAALQDQVSGLGIYPRNIARYPFDLIGLAMVSKGFSISAAVLALLEAGHPDEAYGLSRSLVECALNLRFLTQDKNLVNARTLEYARFDIKDKQYWMHYALENAADDPMRQQSILDHAKEHGLTEDPTGAGVHWSGKKGFAWNVNLEDHPLDNSADSELAKKSRYAVEYHGTSSFVHCYSPALSSFLPVEGEAFSIRESSGQWNNPSQKTLFTLISYLHSCVAYALFAMNIERTEAIDELFNKALASLLPDRGRGS